MEDKIVVCVGYELSAAKAVVANEQVKSIATKRVAIIDLFMSWDLLKSASRLQVTIYFSATDLF